MALMRSTTAASTWINHWPSIAPHRLPCRALRQRRGNGVTGPSSAAHSREVRPRWNFWSRGPFVVVRGGHRGCEHSGKLAKTHRIVELDKKVFSLEVFGAAVTSVRRSNRRHHLG